MFNSKAQLTVFVIIALLLVVGVGGYFVVKNYFPATIPASIQPLYDYYLSCLEKTTSDGTSIMASQGGYIDLPDFYSGSEYAPFSSQLGFMGLGIPYWYYISANGVAKEQIPTKASMEAQLGKYIKEEANRCDFSDFRNQGYDVTLEVPSAAKAKITADSVQVSLSQRLVVDYGETHFILSSHSFEEDSEIGSLYDTAKQIYSYEKNKMFLENYSLDVLYTYAPVDGVLLQCSPALWNPQDVATKLKDALSVNIGAIKMNGEYYTSKNKYTNYFITGRDSSIKLMNQQVSFQYSPAWPSRIEIWPTENNMMKAEPIGAQQGLGTLGFCYVPYKFVYDVYFPVLVQVFNKNNPQEIFQFPFAVVISKNTARAAGTVEYLEQEETICDKANSDLIVNTYNINLEPVEADIEFKCLNDVCNLGKTELSNSTGIASLNTLVPQCINGIVSAKAEGYKEKRYMISTNEQNSAEIVLDKEYTLSLEIYVDNILTNELSVLLVNEKIEDASKYVNSVSYPFSKKITISEGDYRFELKVYKNSQIKIPATTTTQCVTAPREGVLGLLGLKEEKCTDLTVPSQTLTNYVYAGGKQNQYILPDQLANAKVFRVYARSVPTPQNVEQAQGNYDAVEGKNLEIQII